MPALKALTVPLKGVFKRRLPSLWVRWHLARCAGAVEREVALLKHIVPTNGIAVDIGANLGVYTRELARIAIAVHAFEPSTEMASILRRTSAGNVVVHEVALSDRSGEARLRIPRREDGLIHSLASIEPLAAHPFGPSQSIDVPLARLDSFVADDVTFVKIDVEGHELKVLEGATGVMERSQPIFLVEAEERHRPGAVRSVDAYFRGHGYSGYFLRADDVVTIAGFDAATLQDEDSLEADGGRKPGRHYVNNFFYFPQSLDGKRLLLTALQA